MALLSTAAGVSRVHASRRFFDILQEHDIDIPVIHQRVFTAGIQINTCSILSFLYIWFLLIDLQCKAN